MPTVETQLKVSQKPTVALTLGDPAGIGPELMAKLLDRGDVIDQAKVVLVGDAWLWEEGQAVAGVTVPTRTIHSFDQAGTTPEGSPFFLAVETAHKSDIPRSTSSMIQFRRGSRDCCASPSLRRPSRSWELRNAGSRRGPAW